MRDEHVQAVGIQIFYDCNELTEKSREQRKRPVSLLGPEKDSVCLALESSFKSVSLQLLYILRTEKEREV